MARSMCVCIHSGSRQVQISKSKNRKQVIHERQQLSGDFETEMYTEIVHAM